MDYQIKYSEVNGLTVTLSGLITVEGVCRLIDDLEPMLKEVSSHLICDYSEASAELLDSEDIWKISADSLRLGELMKGKKLAVVLVEDMEYGMGRMWQSFTELKVDFEIKIFRSLEDAEKWISQKDTEDILL